MNDIKLKNWLSDNYPGLKIKSPGIIEGNLSFDVYYDKDLDVFFINPTDLIHTGRYRIKDQYQIQINFTQSLDKIFPILKEVGGRIKQSAKKHKVKDLMDMHMFASSEELCVAPRPQILMVQKQGYNIEKFIQEFVVPFFYQQSYFRFYGKWPKENFSHGYQSIFEFYYRNRKELDLELILVCIDTLNKEKTEIKSFIHNLLVKLYSVESTTLCFCKSKKLFKNCHLLKFSTDAWKGINLIMNDIKIADRKYHKNLVRKLNSNR